MVAIVAIVAFACLAGLAVVVAGFVSVASRNAMPHVIETAHFSNTKGSEWQRDVVKANTRPTPGVNSAPDMRACKN